LCVRSLDGLLAVDEDSVRHDRQTRDAVAPSVKEVSKYARVAKGASVPVIVEVRKARGPFAAGAIESLGPRG